MDVTDTYCLKEQVGTEGFENKIPISADTMALCQILQEIRDKL